MRAATALRAAFLALLVTTTAGADPVRVVSLPANDLVYDPATKKIYASVPSAAGSIGNTITAIDPETGQIGPSVPVGSEPGKLVVADQGGTIYASLDGAAAVRRFDTVTGMAGLQFSLGNGYGPNYADDLAVVPGHPDRVAISLYNKGISPGGVGVFIFENGAPLPKFVKGVNALAYSDDPSRLYGYDNQSTGFGFLRMHADDRGIPGGDWLILMTGFGVRIQFVGGRIYDTSGGVWDPEAGRLLGHLPGGVIRPDSQLGRVFILQGDGPNVQLAAYDASAFNQLWSAKIPGVKGGVGSLIRWGADGLAFRSSGGQVFLLHTGEVSVAPAPFSLTLNPTTATGEVTVLGTVALASPAPPGGATVLLSTSDPMATTIPPQVTVAAGATTAAFPVAAHPVSIADDVVISATYGGVTHTAALHLVPPLAPPVSAGPTQLALFPNPVPGGLLALGQVILPQPAGAGGVLVTLTSSSPAIAVVPARIIVLPDAGTVTFPIVTFPVAGPTPVTITASSALGPATATLQVLPLSSPPLPAPTNLTARVRPGPAVQLTWQANSSDENAFAVWRRTENSDWTRIAVLVPNTTTFLDPNVSPGVTYTYRVRATRGNVASDWSNEVSVTPFLINGITYATSDARETLTAPFTRPDGGVNVSAYKGYVLLHVTGVGQSYGPVYNDAFYLYTGPWVNSPQNGHDGGYYQLTFGTSPLPAFCLACNAENFLVGPLPPYNPAHDYTFVLDTRLSSPGPLHFGVSDGGYNDNTGAYTLTVTQLVPSP